MTKPLCVECQRAPAELAPSGRGWKKRCATCEYAVRLKADRERNLARLREKRAAGARIPSPAISEK